MNLHVSSRQSVKPWWRQIEWPVIAAFTGLVLVIALIFGLFQALRVAESSSDEKDQLLSQAADQLDSIDELHALLRKTNQASRAERKESRQERRRLLRQQTIMIKLLRQSGVLKPGQVPGDIIVINPDAALPQDQSGDLGGTPAPAPETPDSTTPQPPSQPDPPRPPGSGGGQPNPPADPPRGPVRGLLDEVTGLPCDLLRVIC